MVLHVSNILFYKTVFSIISLLTLYSFAVNISSSSFGKTEPSCADEQNNIPDETRETFPKRDGRLMQRVSNVMYSPFTAPRRQSVTCGAYIPTPFQMWTMCDGRIFHYNNWSEQAVSSCPVEAQTSPVFSVSDNSAFVKYCSQPPRMENNSFRFGHSSSEEAAAVLASFGNSEHGMRNRWGE